MDLDIKEMTIKKVFETIIGNSTWTGYQVMLRKYITYFRGGKGVIVNLKK